MTHEQKLQLAVAFLVGVLCGVAGIVAGGTCYACKNARRIDAADTHRTIIDRDLTRLHERVEALEGDVGLTHLLHDGSVGYNAQLQGPGVHVNSDQSFWVAHPGQTPQLMVREWEFLPHREGMARLRTLERTTYNQNGTVAFTGGLNGLDGRGDTGVWYGMPGDFELVLQEGDLVPGHAGIDVGMLQRPQLNNRDLLVFDAGLRFIGHPESPMSSVWAFRDGVLVPIVVTGDLINVAAPGETPDLREVDSVYSGQSALEDGALHALNDSDQLALVVYFGGVLIRTVKL